MALCAVRHGSVRNPSCAETGSCCYSQYPTLTDFSQSHEGLLAEPQRAHRRNMTGTMIFQAPTQLKKNTQ